MLIQSNALTALTRFRSSNVPLPENNFRGENNPRYSDPQLDALLDRYFVTVPPAERLGVLQGINHLHSEQLVVMGIFYSSNPFLVAKRLRHVGEHRLAALNWNLQDWDVIAP